MVDPVEKSRGLPLWPSVTLRLKLIFVVLLMAGTSVSAQGQPEIDDDVAPPPLKILSQDEKSKLGAEVEVKRRTKLALDFMEARLKQAETFHAAQSYDDMFAQLGAFNGLMDNMLEFLTKGDRDSGKVLNNFKRFEIGLRGFTPRLQVIHHDVPTRYERYVRNLIRHLRAARTKAIEPLFDDTVVPDKKPV